MPATYAIDPQRRLVLSRAWGTLTSAEVADHYRALATDPEFDPSFSQLADLTEVERVDMSPASVRREALEVVFGPRALRAFVVETGEQEATARLYGLFGKYVGQNVRVFTGIGEAERWLGLTPAEARPPLAQRPPEPRAQSRMEGDRVQPG